MQKADSLCEQAERAERDARDAERKSAERERFLKGKGGLGLSGGTFSSGNATGITQSVRAQVAQARAILPRIRQGVAAANQDRGVVPGLSQYFSQMENSIGTALQAIETCLDSPERCSVPSIYCPSPPNIPVYNKNVTSADLIRKIQESYRQAASAAHQACLSLQVEASRDLERLKQESRTAAMKDDQRGGAGAQRFGETDLYLKRAESLKREAAQYRTEADGLSGITGYCRSRQRSRLGADRTHAIIEAFKAGDKQNRKPETGLRLDATAIDLKADWERTWNKGRVLGAPEVPLPKAEAGQYDETRLDKVRDYLSEKGPWWWYKAKSLYREADEQVELTEFIKSRPKELVKDVVTELVENSLGSFGKSVTTGYKILGAVKTTSDEVGEILSDAPRVIAFGSGADAKELAGRAGKVPLKLYNEIFDDVTGKFPPPRYRYEYKKALGDDPGN